MAGIAGIALEGQEQRITWMLEQMAHRGRAGSLVRSMPGCTLGLVWGAAEAGAAERLSREGIAADGADPGREASISAAGFTLRRDLLGAAPLYYGADAEGVLCAASEVKGLLAVTTDIHALPPGSGLEAAAPPEPELDLPPAELTARLWQLLEEAVRQGVQAEESGIWLSGGLDSSILALLAAPHARRLHTFTGGFPGAPDLDPARNLAGLLHARHHEVIVQLRDCLRILPKVIFHLESFDTLLVRSSIIHYILAGETARHVGEVFSGDGADELFAGHDHLKGLPPERLPAELARLEGALHQTVLQRTDRCSAAHGLTVRIPYLQPALHRFAARLPLRYKIVDGVDKWILRQAASGRLPAELAMRPKARFWESAGVGEIMAENAAIRISDAAFARERLLPNGWTLESKEQLMYYRIFKEHFGACENLEWMGRTQRPEEAKG